MLRIYFGKIYKSPFGFFIMKDMNLFRVRDSVCLREVSSKEEVLKDLDFDGFLIRGNEKVARSIIASLKDIARNSVPSKLGTEVPSSSGKVKWKIGIYGGDDSFNRRVIETLKIDYLVSPEKFAKFDNLKQRDGGLNHVVAKTAAEKGIRIVVDMGEIAGLRGREKAMRLAKVMQNVKVCRKVGCRILIASLGRKKSEVFDEKGRKSFGGSLGMSSFEVRDCVLF